MRWKKPEVSNQRIRSGFLWFPRECRLPSGKREGRWLERATWREEHKVFPSGSCWCCIEWLDGETEGDLRGPDIWATVVNADIVMQPRGFPPVPPSFATPGHRNRHTPPDSLWNH